MAGPYDSREMARRGRIGAAVTNGTHDVRELTAPARAAFRLKFETSADPDGLLPPEERARRGAQLRRAHYLRMAHASVRSRQRGIPQPEQAA